MLEIEQLYGVEVIVHVEPQSTEKIVNGLIQARRLDDWIEGTVVLIGNECKKGLKIGDKVVISKSVYQEAPVLSKDQFDFKTFETGTFHIMTEYLILMKTKSETKLEFVPGVISEDSPDPSNILLTKNRADL